MNDWRGPCLTAKSWGVARPAAGCPRTGFSNSLAVTRPLVIVRYFSNCTEMVASLTLTKWIAIRFTPGFTATYNVNRLVYYELYGHIRDAIAREKRLKRWTRARKNSLVESMNPTWKDLFSTLS